jgi:BirA family biotin operon repressor/biotin-[acetyl-CoA-carboxylase] ligase
LGIHEALTELRIPNLNIKWPNDILSDNKKIGGILIENFFAKGKLIASVIGVGLNLNQQSFKNITNATSLRKVTGNIWDQKELLEVLMQFLHRFLFQTDFQDIDAVLIKYNDKLWKRNKRATFESNSSIFIAIPKGVSIEGKLIIETDEKQILEKDTNQIRMLYNSNIF